METRRKIEIVTDVDGSAVVRYHESLGNLHPFVITDEFKVEQPNVPALIELVESGVEALHTDPLRPAVEDSDA